MFNIMGNMRFQHKATNSRSPQPSPRWGEGAKSNSHIMLNRTLPDGAPNVIQCGGGILRLAHGFCFWGGISLASADYAACSPYHCIFMLFVFVDILLAFSAAA